MRLRLLPPVEAATTPEEATPILEYLMRRGGLIAIDTETTGLDRFRDRVLFWSMATEDRRFFFTADLLVYFDRLFQRQDVTWAKANAKYDLHLLKNHGVVLAGNSWDIAVMNALEDDTRDHGLKEQARDAYDVRWGDFKNLFLDPVAVAERLGLDAGGYAGFKKMSGGEKLKFVYEEDHTLVENYASCDAFFTYMRAMDLCHALAAIDLPTSQSEAMASMLDYYCVIEVPLTKTLWNLERRGILVDIDFLKTLDGPMRDSIKGMEVQLRDISGKKTLNPNSPEELRDVLYTEKGFGLKPPKYTKGGHSDPVESTDAKSLDILLTRLSPEKKPKPRQFVATLIEYRKVVKLHGTYVKNQWSVDPVTRQKIPNPKLYGPDGRIHTIFNQTGARTARLSSSSPNLQQIPVKTDLGKQLRKGFISKPGYLLTDHDYPQIEFRVAAVLAQEPGMIAAMNRGWDIHNENTIKMYGAMTPGLTYEVVKEAQIKEEARKRKEKVTFTDLELQALKFRKGAKAIGLGVMYGKGDASIAAELVIEKEAAKALREDFFAINPNIKAFIDDMHEYAWNNGFTYTLLGRRRMLHRISNDYNRGIAAAEERQAQNTPIQGSSAEMMKLAMMRVDTDPRLKELGFQLILTVHDELIGEAPAEVAKECAEIVGELMAHPFHWGPNNEIDFEFPVDIKPDGAVGKNWGEAH